MALLQALPAGVQLGLMQLCPGLDKPRLPAREAAANELDLVDPVDRNRVLILGVKVRAVMWCAGLCVHPYYDSKEAR